MATEIGKRYVIAGKCGVLVATHAPRRGAPAKCLVWCAEDESVVECDEAFLCGKGVCGPLVGAKTLADMHTRALNKASERAESAPSVPSVVPSDVAAFATEQLLRAYLHMYGPDNLAFCQTLARAAEAQLRETRDQRAYQDGIAHLLRTLWQTERERGDGALQLLSFSGHRQL